MASSTGARSALVYISETTFGTTPASTPVWTGPIPFVSNAMEVQRGKFEDNSIQADRMEHFMRLGAKVAQGDVTVNFSSAVYDTWLESLMCAAFASQVLKVGTTRKSIVLEEQHLDISQYILYNGCVVNSMNMNVPTTGLVTAQFGLIGTTAAVGSTTSTTLNGGSVSPSASRDPMTHLSGTFKEGGSTVATLTAIQFTVNNGYAPTYTLGSNSAHDIVFARQTISGTVSAYFEDASLLNKFLNETTTAIEFTLTDGTHTVNFKFPNVKYSGGNKPIQNDGVIALSLPFTALYDNTATSTLVITNA